MLKQVQCESCHGAMGTTIYDHEPNVSFATREGMSLCVKCHEQVEEWEESGHGMVLEAEGTIEDFTSHYSRSSCNGCHTSEGFISDNDPDWPTLDPEVYSLVGCPTCHDPHSDDLEHQLRNLDDVTVAFDSIEAATFTGFGNAQLCAQCHHARRDVDNVLGQIANGYAHFGPHGSPQMDLALGSGSYEIDGYTYERDHIHQSVEESCVTCHMTMRSHSDPLGWKGGHDFEPSVVACQGCHPGLTEEGVFDFNGGQTEIETLMDSLLTLIGVPEDSLGSATATTAEQRMAGYAYVFVGNDGSHGVHNPAYAKALLENAIEFLGTLDSPRNQGTYARR
jgi:hypothetical protein